MSVTPTWSLLAALVLLVVLAVVVSAVGRLGTSRAAALAAVRAVAQLSVVSLVIVAVLRSLLWSLLFVVFMLGVGIVTSAQRLGAPRAWRWVALSMLAGVVPVLAIIFGLQAVPLTTSSLVAIAGIIVGGAMTASTLNGRRCFTALREEHHLYEAGLSIGLPRGEAVTVIVERRLKEALVPGLDQTRTVGLVTLPGAFVGVLLGGGTPLQAGAAQILVLCGLLATQTIVVVAAHMLIRSGRLLPDDLRVALHP